MNLVKVGFCLILALYISSNWAIALPFATTSVSTISPCPSFCGGSSGSSDFDLDGGEGEIISFSSLDNSDGSGRSQGRFVGPSLLPELSAEAFSNAGVRSSRVSSHATVMQEYLYSGEATNVTLSAVFDGSISGEADITGSLVLISAINGVDVPLSTDYGTLVFEIIPLTDGLTELGSDRSFLNSTGINLLEVTFNVNDGDSIFVWSDLIAEGIRGGAADAFNTMSLAFSDPKGFAPQLRPDIAPIPEPSSFLLLGGGLAGLAFYARRRRKE